MKIGWHARTRASLGITLDRCVMADSNGYRCEVVEPKWWDLPRLWVWLFKANGRVEFTCHGPDGQPVHVVRRTRTLAPPKPQSIVIDGRVITPKPVSPEALARNGHDPDHRLIPDEVLERNHITRRDRHWN
jgi:hypothetical protein